MSPFDLSGRVALVTGAGGLVGGAAARALAAAGAQVALVDSDGARLSAAAAAIGVDDGDALPFEADVTDALAVERMVDHVLSEWGRIDVLVNQAHVGLPDQGGEEGWQRALDVHLGGARICTEAVAAHMVARGAGRILSGLSVAALLGAPGRTAEATSGGGLIALTRTWAREYGPAGVTANAIAAGLVEGAPTLLSDAERDALVARLPARRAARPEEVGAVYLFMASDLAAFMNGAVVGVDGGLRL
ncbi:MAG: SDR family oxidoreductase [Vicinamibacteria bacterium]|nr:SDR family oxidoreductase [Vicinamibacteria bacterium]